MRTKNKKQEISMTLATFPLADPHKKNPINNATIPSEDAVIEAKEWVDFNEK